MTRSRSTARLHVTPLEDRVTPSSVGLDTTYGKGGRFVLSDSLNVTGAALPRIVVALPDGESLVGTTATSAGGNQDFAVFRLTAAGTLDTSFGSGGVATIPFDDGGTDADVLNAMTVQSDGSILVSGYAEQAGGDTDFAVARLTANGTLDTTFGTGGKTTVAFNLGGLDRDGATGVAVDSAGRIVIGGYAETASGGYDFAAARLTTGGVLDTTFGTGGKVTVGFNLMASGANVDKAAAVGIGPSNTVVLVGSASNGASSTATAVVRLLATGAPDTSLNGTGEQSYAAILGTTAANAAAAVSVASDGRILIAGTVARTTATNTDMYVGRLTATGAPDTTFGTNGFTAVAFDRGGQNADVGNALTVDSSQNILVAGSVDVGGGAFNFGLVRLTPAGALDPTFGQGGEATVAFARGGTNADAATGVAVQSDGRILLAGVVQTAATAYDAGVARLAVGGGLPSTLLVGGSADGTTAIYTAGSTGQYSSAGTINPFGGSFVVRTAVADVNGDGVPDDIYAIGPGGGSLVRVVDGATGQNLVAPTATFESGFTGGIFVAAADIGRTGKADIIVSPDVGGGGRVQVFSVQNGGLTLVANFFGITDATFRGGARVAAGDVNGDGTPDLVVGAGFGGGPRVAIFDGTTLSQASPTRLVNDFFAFPGSDATSLRNGVFVAAGDVNGDGRAELVFGGGPGGGPRVFVLDGATVMTSGASAAQAAPVANYFAAGDSTSRGGVRVAVKDVDGDGLADVVTGSGEGLAASVRVYSGRSFPASGEPVTAQTLAVFGGATEANGVYVG